MGGQISGQGEDGEQSRTSGQCAGQHTTGVRQQPEAMSSGDPDTTPRTHRSSPHKKNSRIGALSGWAGSNPSQGPSIKVGRAGCECGSVNTTVGGIQKAAARLAMTARGSVGSSHCAHGTRPHIFERHQPTDTVAANNYFRHVCGAKVRMPCCSEGKAQQLSRTERAGSPEWQH